MFCGPGGGVSQLQQCRCNNVCGPGGGGLPTTSATTPPRTTCNNTRETTPPRTTFVLLHVVAYCCNGLPSCCCTSHADLVPTALPAMKMPKRKRARPLKRRGACYRGCRRRRNTWTGGGRGETACRLLSSAVFQEQDDRVPCTICNNTTKVCNNTM
jgi:hypothetical protein